AVLPPASNIRSNTDVGARDKQWKAAVGCDHLGLQDVILVLALVGCLLHRALLRPPNQDRERVDTAETPFAEYSTHWVRSALSMTIVPVALNDGTHNTCQGMHSAPNHAAQAAPILVVYLQ